MFGRINTTSVLAMSCDLVGHLAYSGTLEILGRVEGDITVSGKVIVGPSGCCISNIKADAVEIYGEVQGYVETIILRLGAGGKLIGDAKYKSIIMEEGAVFERVTDEGQAVPAADPCDAHPDGLAAVVDRSQVLATAGETVDPAVEKQPYGEPLPEPAPDKEVSQEKPPAKKPRFQTVF